MKTNSLCRLQAATILFVSTAAVAEDARGSTDRWWFSAEALHWWVSDAPQPTPFATSGSFSDFPFTGALGQPGTRIEIGGGSISLPAAAGGRFTAGGLIDRASGFGVEASGFLLGPARASAQVFTDGLPGSKSHAVPLFDESGFTSGGTPGEAIYVLPSPFPNGPGFTGHLQRNLSTRLHGAEVSGVLPIHETGGLRVQALAGYRWLAFDEDLSFSVDTAGVTGSRNEGEFFRSRDEFRTQNTFHGAQIGFRAQIETHRVFAETTVKGALGAMHRRLSIEGASSTSAGTVFYHVADGAGESLAGGIFAQPSNIGTYDSAQLAGVFEAGLRVGFRLTDWLMPYLAYNALYTDSVLRPGNAVDRSINTTATPLAAASRASGFDIPTGGPAAPSANPKSSSIWVQGISIGMVLRF